MLNWQKWVAVALLVAVVACTTFVAGFGVGRYLSPAYLRAAGNAPQEQQERLRVLWEAWGIIEREFYSEKPLDYEAMTYGAARGMVASLGDPYTTFLTPAQREMFNQDLEGEFGGIGVSVSMTKEGQLQIVKALSGQPAEQAGLKPGDVILEVDGRPIQGLDQAQAISLIRGLQDTEVRLLIRRVGQDPFEVALKRVTIVIPSAESRMLDNGVAYLGLSEFNARATAEVRAGLDQLMKQNPRGLILDLRGNPGGYLHVAEEIASEFIPDGLVLIERGRDGTETRHVVRGGGRATKIPLAVLVDHGSASAAEIVAGAIQDHKRGPLIGEQTLGKGSVQVTEQLSDKSGLHVTIRRWYTPDDHQINGKGLAPDIEVTMDDQDLQAQRDPQLERAIAYLLAEALR